MSVGSGQVLVNRTLAAAEQRDLGVWHRLSIIFVYCAMDNAKVGCYGSRRSADCRND